MNLNKSALWAALSLLFVSLFAGNAYAQDSAGIATVIGDFFSAVGVVFAGYVFATVEIFGTDIELIVIWLALPMLIFTAYFGFISLRPKSYRQALKIVKGHYRDDSAPGQVSQFQALTTALSGTVGLGNIGGVAIAISMGGPGALFWMIIIGFAAMSLKFAECTLGVKYREVHADGSVSGGPMYYLRNGLAARGLPKLGAVLAGTYALFAMPSIVQFVQVNQAFSQFSAVTGYTNGLVFGIVLATATGAVIFGGITTVGKVTSKLVPIMGGLYVGTALIIILAHFTDIPAAIYVIITDAFASDSLAGGIVGSIIVGMRRAVYSTEAGLGSATIAHSAAKTHEPISQGMLALMEPFIDVIIIATMTALVIVITGAYELEGLNDIQMTSAAFGSVISWFPWVLAVAVILFAFSTIISWGYYLEKIWTFVLGESRIIVIGYRILFVVLIVPGAVMTVDQVIDFMDAVFFLMAVPNIVGLYILAPELKRDLKAYFARIESGEISEVAAQPQPAE
jgi:alanine or glycine:cation symporter, AGCS family